MHACRLSFLCFNSKVHVSPFCDKLLTNILKQGSSAPSEMLAILTQWQSTKYPFTLVTLTCTTAECLKGDLKKDPTGK